MSVVPDREDARSAEEATQDVQYNVFLWDLHRRLYNKLVGWIAFIELGLGSAAIYTAFNIQHQATGAIGVILAGITILNHVWGPSTKSMRAQIAKTRYTDLKSECHKLSLEEIDSRMAKLDAQDPDTIEGLRAVAFNYLVESLSKFSHCRKLTLWEKFLKGLA